MQSDEIKLTFLGAAGEVTGSSYLVETANVQFLVDCGMFQGDRGADEKNRRALSTFDVKSLDFVLITHAHLDHIGLVPRLIAFGYEGPIYTSHTTAALMEPMLLDSAFIQEKDAINDIKRARRRGENAPEIAPLYTVQQAKEALDTVKGVDWERPYAPHPDVEIMLRNTGHILGSASIDCVVRAGARRTRIVFSGDVGSPNRILVPDPISPPAADVLLIESTYGNRLHRPVSETRDELVSAIERTHASKGNVYVPAFALGRCQEIIVVLLDLVSSGKLKHIPTVFIDSPLAEKATEITWKHASDTDKESQALVKAWKSGKIPLQVIYTKDANDSKALNNVRSGAMIIAGSGMCEAGRIRHHLHQNLWRPECSVVFVGYQGQGTLGRTIVDGAKTVRINGDEVPVHAKVYTIGGLSAHADQAGLIHFMRGIKQAPSRTFIVHGEQAIATEFSTVIGRELGWASEIPSAGMTVAL